MRAVTQRVLSASVEVDGAVVGAIASGLLVYVGVGRGDGPDDVAWTADKVVGLRIFADDAGKMSRSVSDVGGAVLAVSQFTLYGDTRKGRRPSFDDAAPPELARALYEDFCARVRAAGPRVETGRFAADMRVISVGDGPVTILLDSKKAF